MEDESKIVVLVVEDEEPIRTGLCDVLTFHGYATEASAKVLDDARERELTPKVIATADIPNTGSIRVLEKLEFEFIAKIEAYGSSEMYLYTKQLV